MRYTERGYAYSKDGKYPYVEVYDQPLWRHLAWRIYHAYDTAFIKVMPWKKIEKIDEWWHRRHCNDNCMTGEVWRRGEGSKVETYCAHMPFGCRQDCRCFDLSMKGRTRVSYWRSEVAEDEAGRVGPEASSQPL